ncbi:MAG: hypothetical protein GWP06_09305 [Actinobacteria bacterium]|nr:hypothetical protein [Actinomycetota bacterium]
MPAQTVKIDKKRRIKLPEKMCDVIGLLPETDVIIELTDNGLFIKPKLSATPITKRIANMGLPVTDWIQMEKEIERGHLR